MKFLVTQFSPSCIIYWLNATFVPSDVLYFHQISSTLR